jgi:hypothetical protein
MTTMTTEQRLNELGHQIEALEAHTRAGGGEPGPRMQRHIDALRRHEAHAWAVTGDAAAHEADGTLAQLEARLEVADRSLAADAAEGKATYILAVEKELRSWDAYLERVQASAVARAGRARERAEAAIRELRKQRLEVGRQLQQLQAGPETGWRQKRPRVTAAREHLEHTADDLTTDLH